MYKSMLICFLPIIGTDAAGNRPPIISATAGRPNTGHRTATAKQPEHINHSGNVGNRFQAPQNQQNPSDHDRLMTSNPNCHKYQTILKICTVSFQIMPEVKKRYIIRTACESRSRNRIQQKRQAECRKRPDRNSFQILATILIFCGRGFANRYFTEIQHLYAPCPDCPDLFPNIYLWKPSGTIQHFPTFFQRFQRFERIGVDSSNAFNALNARLKPPIPRLNAVFGRKTANSQH